MSKFLVEIPIAGSICFEVDADTKEGAIEAAWSKFDGGSEPDDISWEALESIANGYVCNAPLNSISVEKIE